MSDTPTGSTPVPWRWVRLAAGALLLGALVWRIGPAPFVAGLRLTTTWSLLVAVGVTAVTTACCAWRWQLVAEGLGVRIGLGPATAAIYRAQFLNATLPGGVLGDVDRAVGHARRTGAAGTAVRSVAWERVLGQLVQVVLTVAVLLVLPSPLHRAGAAGATLVLAVGLALVVARSALRGRPGRLARAVRADVRAMLRTRRRRAAIGVASCVAAAGHVCLFVVAARVAGAPAPAITLLPLAAVVLLAAALPLNVAGWGPREGAAAWAFGAAGLGIDTGATAAVVYGVMALVATLPGAVVLLVGRARPSASPAQRPGDLQVAACA